MDYVSPQNQPIEHIHFGHLGAVLFVAVLLVGFGWLKNPQMFSVLQKPTASSAAAADIPHYYAYVTPSQDELPLVAGASTENTGPSIINEDGSVVPAVDSGSVLGASTDASATELTLNQIAVNKVPDSQQAIQNYISQSANIEGGYINNDDFETALSSGDQAQINVQAQKIQTIISGLEKLQVPASFVSLQKLKILQYTDGVGLLTNFTQADSNPQLVGQYMNDFLNTQQQLNDESISVEQKLNIDLGYPIDTATSTTADALQPDVSQDQSADTSQTDNTSSFSDYSNNDGQ